MDRRWAEVGWVRAVLVVEGEVVVSVGEDTKPFSRPWYCVPYCTRRQNWLANGE